MPRQPFTPEDIQELRHLARQWGKIIARRAFGDAGPGLDVDLAAMEQVAQAAAEGLTEGTLQTCLEQQVQRLGPTQPCPDCGRSDRNVTGPAYPYPERIIPISWQPGRIAPVRGGVPCARW